MIQDVQFINQILILKLKGKQVIPCTQLPQLPFSRDPLLTDLSVVFNNKICEVLFYELIEDMFVGTVIDKLLAVHDFSLGQTKKTIRGQ